MFVLAPGNPTKTLDLGPIDGARFRDQLDGAFSGPAHVSRSARDVKAPGSETEHEVVERNTRVLALLEEVYTAIFESGGRSLQSILSTSPARKLTMIVSGWLARVPLAVCGVDRGCLFDAFDGVSFAPSAALLVRAWRTSARRDGPIVTVANPDGTLPYARAEFEFLQHVAGAARVTDVTHLPWAEAAGSVAAARIIHIATHGQFDPTDPLASKLVIGDGTLSLADVYMGTMLNPGCLVTLAACQTGLFDPRFADEFLGLPAAFLYAGASGVVSTLWKVDDLATMFLMQKFYEAYLAGTSSSLALNRAQRWLRNASLRELSMLPGGGTALDGRALDDRPFSDVRYWAGFVHTGA